jgi:hypothetical protein
VPAPIHRTPAATRFRSFRIVAITVFFADKYRLSFHTILVSNNSGEERFENQPTTMENVHANACVQAFKKLIFVRLTIYIQV